VTLLNGIFKHEVWTRLLVLERPSRRIIEQARHLCSTLAVNLESFSVHGEAPLVLYRGGNIIVTSLRIGVTSAARRPRSLNADHYG
jgi:hypothetical protein